MYIALMMRYITRKINFETLYLESLLNDSTNRPRSEPRYIPWESFWFVGAGI